MMTTYSLVNDEWTKFLQGLEELTANGSSLFQAVGEVVKECTLENFGPSGTNRPKIWEPLSKDYARKVKREYATLEVTGALKSSVEVEPPSADSITITATDDKASYHQLGEGRNKERPFFPISADGDLTGYCQNHIADVLDEQFSIK